MLRLCDTVLELMIQRTAKRPTGINYTDKLVDGNTSPHRMPSDSKGLQGIIVQISNKVTNILLDSGSSIEAFILLLEIRKSQIRVFSLSSLSKRTGISKSYLSEIISKKKSLQKKHLLELGRFLKLGHLEQNCFECLHEFDKAKNHEQKSEALKNLNTARKILRLVAHEEMPSSSLLLLEFDIYAAFGLFGGTPTREQLCEHFSRVPKLEVIDILNTLLRRKAILQNEAGRYEYTKQGFVFNASERPAAFLEIWRQSIQDALAQLPKWSTRGTESCFVSYVVSIKKEHMIESLEKFKKQLLQFAASSDSDEADGLVRINAQVYPLEFGG